GETSLATIWGTLPAVEKSANSYLAVINASLMEQPVSSTLLQTRETLALLAEGIAALHSTNDRSPEWVANDLSERGETGRTTAPAFRRFGRRSWTSTGPKRETGKLPA
ncbi:MAG: hypothetical protein WC423_23680, partial [Vulcanimicrobiota bacterium]